MPQALGALGAVSSIFSARKQDKLQKRAFDRAQFQPLNFSQPGGVSVVQGSVQLPNFLKAFQQGSGAGAADILGGTDFSDVLSGQLGQANQNIAGFGGPQADPRTGILDFLSQLGGGAASQAFNMPGVSALQGTQGLQSLLQQGSDFSGLRDSTLANLRASAAPQQQRQVESQFQRLFNTGNLGSTAGANILGRLSEAQNQQDLGFQLAAGGEARAAQQAQTQDLASRFGQLVSGNVQQGNLQNQFLNSAFNRFNQSAQTAGSLTGQAFGRELDFDQAGFGRAQDIFSQLASAAALPTALQGQRVGLAQQLLGGFGTAQGFGLNAFNAALGQERVRSGAEGNIFANVSQPGFNASNTGDALSTVLQSFGGILNQRRQQRSRTGDITNQVEI